MKRISLIVFSVVLIIFLSMGGCGLIGSGIARLTTEFNEWPTDHRVLYEDGAESLAEYAANSLSEMIDTVATRQYGSFQEPVYIYAFSSAESFSRYSGISDKAKGASIDNRVYLSGVLLNVPDEVVGMIGHELSHVQLSQVLGTIDFNRGLPRWFREGLAIYVSDGGGSPRNFEAETIDKFVKGQHITPEESGTLFNIQLKATETIGPRMFYSQSGMFVKYLATEHPQSFQEFLIGLQKKQEFAKVFSSSFGMDVETMLATFIKGLPKG